MARINHANLRQRLRINVIRYIELIQFLKVWAGLKQSFIEKSLQESARFLKTTSGKIVFIKLEILFFIRVQKPQSSQKVGFLL